MPPAYKPLAVTQAEAIELIRSEKIFKRALRAGWIKPVIQGGLGRASIFDYSDVQALWERIKTGEELPKLPSELKGRVTRFLGDLWSIIRGREPDPIYVFLSRDEMGREMAQKHIEAQRQADASEQEKQAMQRKTLERDQEPIKVEVDPNLF